MGIRRALVIVVLVVVALVWMAVRVPSSADPADYPGHSYPPAVAARFADNCERTGPAATCLCLYRNLEARYSYRRFQALVAADNPRAPEYAVVARDCAGQ